ncbi:MAG: hypothetical protein PHC61_13625 [Chitinivibrionales bacterium]|nr:hypothetical protein [Chitinivibrionales bacterium]
MKSYFLYLFAAGYTSGIGYFFISKIINYLYIYSAGANAHQDDKIRPGYNISSISGIVERLLYLGSLIIGKPEFIGLWLGLKTAGEWGHWHNTSENGVGRKGYLIFLIGTALSLSFSFISWKSILLYQSNSICKLLFLDGTFLFVITVFLLIFKYKARKAPKRM